MSPKWQLAAAGLLYAGCVASALGVVVSQYESRQAFAQLQQLNKARDRLNVEWGRLLLEQSTWATHGYIEKRAREELHMELPKQKRMVVVSQ
ncbi:MAG: cell division protein FtsL [Gammaproteobacteria bacterium]|jgi:cell division protein FtsL